MKKWTLSILTCLLVTVLSAQVQPQPASTDGISKEASTSPNTKKKLSKANQVDREYLVKTYKEKGDQAFQKGNYQEALKSYRRIQSLNPSPANNKKILDCQRSINKHSTKME